MKTDFQHIPFAELADLAEDRITAENRGKSMTHLTECSKCQNELHRLEQLIQSMRSDRESDVPRDLVAYAIGLFGQRRQTATQSRVRRIIAALSFDSGLNLAPAFGVRSGDAQSRQLIYSAAGFDIDLRVVPEGDRYIISGQLLGEDCAGTTITIESEEQSASADLSELCEFSLPPVMPGTYVVTIRTSDVEVQIPEFDVRV
ncbi:MAG TPA: hypothetical protein VLA93_13510 [Pyrinomonadaceae bacterium]|nr:hypothetical protein [Pyrinomonadaceae bacterium]